MQLDENVTALCERLKLRTKGITGKIEVPIPILKIGMNLPETVSHWLACYENPEFAFIYRWIKRDEDIE